MEKAEKDKVSHNGEDEDEQHEDMKMEKFFALMRSFGEARKRLRKELMEDEDNTDNQELKKKNMMIRKRRTAHEQQQYSSPWVPSFQWEDFTTDIDFIRPPAILPNPCNYNNKEPNKQAIAEDNGLDLQLKL